MADPAPDKWKKLTFKNPLVWLGIVIALLLALRFALPEQYLSNLPAMLTASGRCAVARQELANPRDAAGVCSYGIKSADAVSQLFVAEVYFQNKRYYGPERDAEARDLFDRAIAQIKPKAEAGDKEAQALLGRIYSESQLLNGTEAAKWLCAAALRGSTDAYTQLALIQGRQLYAGLNEGPNSYAASEWPEKFMSGACKPEKLDDSKIGGTLGFQMCPYKLETPQDYCSTRKL